MAESAVTDTLHDSTLTGNIVLLVSGNGSVRSVLEGPDSLRKKNAGLTLEDLWPGDLVERIKAYIKRTLRSRKVQTDEAGSGEDSRTFEFIYVMQGRDRVLLVVRDVSAVKVTQGRIRQLAYTDEVTDLPNREFLFSELQKITDMQRLKEGRAALICIHFGQFDDHDHELVASQQDLVLKELASRLRAQLRRINDDSEDDYERFSIVARTDFRQFCIVLPSIESGENAEAVADRLLISLREPVRLTNRSVTIRPYGGVALFPQDGTDSSTLFENAVSAAEDAKGFQTAPFKFHSGTVRLRTLQRQDLAHQLESALEREEFTLSYLPVVDASTQAVHAVEALLRWPAGVLGKQSTSKLVTMAERTGIIVPIGEWVLRHACEQLRGWRAGGHGELRLAINVTAQELSRSDLAIRVSQILSETGVDGTDVDFEIREHMLFRDALKQFSACQSLKALGTGLVLDDYGTGACSLVHLSESPIDAIKIDNAFVKNLQTNERDRAACSAAIRFAEGLNLDVIAEGVETTAQAEFLRDAGCRYLQGYLFAEPLAEDQVTDYLDRSRSVQLDAEADS